MIQYPFYFYGCNTFFGENVIPCRDRIGGRAVNECRTTNVRATFVDAFFPDRLESLRLFAICRLHSLIRSLIRSLFVDGLLESLSYGYLRSTIYRPLSPFADASQNCG